MANNGAGFTASELLRVVPGLQYGTLNYWITSGLLDSSARPASGKGSVRRFTLADAVAARVIVAMRGSRISLQQLRRVTEKLQYAHKRATHPLASTTLIVIPGKKADVARVEITDDAATMMVSLLRSPGQQMMAPVVLPLAPLVREVLARVADLDHERDQREAMRRARAREQMREASRRYQARKREQRRGAAMP